MVQGKSNLKTMFVQFILDNIWKVYDAILNNQQEQIEKIVNTLGLKIQPRDLKSKDTSIPIYAIFSQWLPIAKSILLAVVEKIPNPIESQKQRMPKMFSMVKKNYSELLESCCKCDPESNHIVAYGIDLFNYSGKNVFLSCGIVTA